jgi:flavodoxin
MSKVLIVYYSKTGNVRLLAKKAAQLLNADVEELIDKTEWTGIDGFFRRAHRAIIRGYTTLEATKYNPKSYEKILVLSPLWGPTIAPAVRTYLKQNKESISALSLIVLGMYSNSSEAKKEVESKGFKLNGVLGLLDKGQTGKETGELQGENLTKLKEFVERF